IAIIANSVLKKEKIYLHTYQDFREARRTIFEYIEFWYNRKRIHSAIDYMTPQQKEDIELKSSMAFNFSCPKY
ncbi:MAG: IS3 family transposase, partial [Lachnospiraceae bacterium]